MNKKTRFAKFTDKLSLFIVIFLAFYIGLDHLLKQDIIVFATSTFLAILTFVTITREINKRRKNKNLSSQDEEKARQTILALRFGDPIKVRNFLIFAFSKRYLVKNHASHITLSTPNRSIRLVYDFSTPELNLKTVQTLTAKANQNEQIYVLGEAFSQDALFFEKQNKNLHLFNSKAIFLTFKKLNYFPSIKTTAPQATSIASKILNSLNRANAFKFLKFGLLLLGLSVIIPYATYYRLSSFALFILAIISFFRPKYPCTTTPLPIIN